jgi:hypothetical protein
MDKSLLVKIIVSVILFIASFCLLLFKFDSGFLDAFIYGYFIMSIPWGWGWTGDKLGRRSILPKDFFDDTNGSDMKAWGQTFSMVGHVAHWMSRFLLAIVLGGIFFPIAVIKLIIASNKAKKETLSNMPNVEPQKEQNPSSDSD